MSGEFIDILTDKERRLVEDNPETGFISSFTEWAGKKTDAPSYTLQAAALMALSLSAGDTVVLPPFFGKPVHMNLFVMIVGPSTTLRKSTVLGMVRDLLPVNETSKQDYIAIVDDVSVQAFNKVTAEAGAAMAPVLLNVDEVAGLFQTVRRQNSYLAGFDKALMKAYDHAPVHIQRVNSQIAAQNGAFVNIFAASTPEPLMEVLNGDDVESGLLPRFLIFDARGTIRNRRPTLMERLDNQDDWAEGQDALKEHLARIARDRALGIPIGADNHGNSLFKVTQLTVSEEALVRLDEIDAAFTKEAGADETGWAAIKGRGFWHIVKLAGLFALSRAGVDATVEIIDVLRACHLVETTLADLGRMAQEVGANVLERRVNEALEMIAATKTGEIAPSQIAVRLRLSGRDMTELSGTLLIRDLISVDDKTKKWRKK
jgi:hypothetical protein